MNFKRILEIVAKATPGPWVGAWNAGFGVQFSAIIAIRGNHGDYIKMEDAAFIHHARTLMPKLLAVAEAAEQADHLIRQHLGPFASPILDALTALEAEPVFEERDGPHM